MISLRLISVLVFSIICASCASTLQSYPGVKRPTSEIAVLSVQHAFNSDFTRSIHITHINGERIKIAPIDSLELLPGEYSILVECHFTKIFGTNYSYPDKLKISVIAGHSYRIEFQNKQFCLKDLTENTTVMCGKETRGYRLPRSPAMDLPLWIIPF